MYPSVASTAKCAPSNGLRIRGIFWLMGLKTLCRCRFKCGLIQRLIQSQKDPIFPSLPLSSFSLLSWLYSPPHGCKMAAAAPASRFCNFKSSGTWFPSQKVHCASILTGLCFTNHCGKIGAVLRFVQLSHLLYFRSHEWSLRYHKPIY